MTIRLKSDRTYGITTTDEEVTMTGEDIFYSGLPLGEEEICDVSDALAQKIRSEYGIDGKRE